MCVPVRKGMLYGVPSQCQIPAALCGFVRLLTGHLGANVCANPRILCVSSVGIVLKILTAIGYIAYDGSAQQ